MYINGYTRARVMETVKQNNQGYQATIHGRCQYRTDQYDPNCCLVGCFIPDDKYSETMEDEDAQSIIETFELENDMPMDTSLMLELQTFHDEELDRLTGNEFYDSIEKKLIELENKEKQC